MLNSALLILKKHSLLIVGSLVLFSTGSVMYVTAETAYFPEFQIHDDLLVSLTILISNYDKASTHLAEYRDFWGAISISLGAIIAVLTTLRAPHSIIIAGGGLLAVILGNIQLNSPQQKIEALTNAQESMACLQTPLESLRLIKQSYGNTDQSLMAALSDNNVTLSNHNQQITTQLNVLDYWLGHAEHPLIHEAKDELVAGLLKVTPAFNIEKDSIEDFIDNAAQEFYDLYSDDIFLPPSLLSQIEERQARLLNSLEMVEEVLKEPSYAHNDLRHDFQAIQLSIENAHAIKDEGQKYTIQVSSMIESISPMMLSLVTWSSDLMALEELIQANARLVHTRLMAELARTGATAEEITRLSQPISSNEQPTKVAPAPLPTMPREVPPTGVSAGGSAYSEDQELSEQQQARYAEINTWLDQKEKQVAILIKELAPSIMAAEQRINELHTLRDSALATLVQYEQTLSQHVSEFNALKSAYAPAYQSVKSDLALASTLIAAVNVDAMNVKIQSCVT